GLDPQKKTLLIIGGSRGSHLINQAFWQALPFIEKLKFQVIHITGDESFQEAMKMAALYPFPYLIYEFYPTREYFIQQPT
ncbi:MAG TPA: glycosyltransferase, partial [Atribacter sp.]|uniref:glycosyltransferase n=1 Tax=Atribacter sp. TaxID=2847780 RepID=UPI002CCED7A2